MLHRILNFDIKECLCLWKLKILKDHMYRRHFPPLPANINAPTVKYILDAMNEGFANIPYPAESIQAH